MSATMPNPRIISIDALRGFALFGIFYSHMIFWFAGGPLPQESYQLYKDPASMLAVAVYFLLFNAKFFSVFAFLFGLSFHIQINSLAQKSHQPGLRFAWRLAILGGIGALHQVFWRADILSIYALVGLILIPARYLNNRALAILGAIFVFNLPTKFIELAAMLAGHTLPLIDPQYAEDSQAYLLVFTQANFSEMLRHNAQALPLKIAYLINSGRLCMTVGFFLLGMLVGRLQWFECFAGYKQQFAYYCKKGAWGVLAALVLGALVGAGIFATGAKVEGNSWVMWSGGFVFDLLSTCLACVYISGFVLLMHTARGYAVLAPLANIGKMALSSYLLQSLCGVGFFFNVGLGLFGLTAPWQNFFLSLGVFGVLVFLCRIWLRYFRYGPIEWLWRCASDLKWRPIC